MEDGDGARMAPVSCGQGIGTDAGVVWVPLELQVYMVQRMTLRGEKQVRAQTVCADMRNQGVRNRQPGTAHGLFTHSSWKQGTAAPTDHVAKVYLGP